MTCREFTEFLDGYVLGTLAAAQRAEFDAHLAVCSMCRRYLESYRTTVEFARRARNGGPELSNDVPSDLVRAILAARKRAP